MTWEGIRDERIMSRESLSIGRTLPGSVYEQALCDHIDALHSVIANCHELLSKTRADEMTPRDRGWSTVAAVEVILENHLPITERTATS